MTLSISEGQKYKSTSEAKYGHPIVQSAGISLHQLKTVLRIVVPYEARIHDPIAALQADFHNGHWLMTYCLPLTPSRQPMGSPQVVISLVQYAEQSTTTSVYPRYFLVFLPLIFTFSIN